MKTTELLCRTCLKNCRTRFDIFNHTRNNILLADMLANCISLEIRNEDGFPISICNNCMEKLSSAFDFKIMVIESNSKLRELYQGELRNKDLQDIRLNSETVIKTERTSVIDLSCKNEDISVNQTKKGKIDVEVKLEFESLEEGCGFLDDLEGTISSEGDPFGTKQCDIKESLPVPDLCRKNESTQYNRAKNVLGELQFQSFDAKADISDDFPVAFIKSEQTTMTDDEGSHGYQANKEEMDIEVELGLKSLKQNDSLKTNSSLQDPCKSKCEEVKQNVPPGDLDCENEGLLGHRSRKKAINVTAKTGFESPHKNGRVSDKSTGVSLSPGDSLELAKRENIKGTSPAANQKRKRGDDNKKNAELLDNPDYKRIISSRLTKEQKTRETIFCIECNKTFSYYHYVKRHAYIHTGKLPYKCDKCGKRYAKAHMLNKHIRSHLQTRDFPCEACDKAFYQKHHLKEHMAQKHSEERPHKCKVCDRTYKNIGTLWKHSKIHMKNKDFLCEICGRDFTQMKKLTTHRKSHAIDENLVCSTCDKAFDEKRALNSHLKEHRAPVNPRTRKKKDTLGNRTDEDAVEVKTRLEWESLNQCADVSDDSAATLIKIEETTITGLPCQNEDIV